MSLGIAGFLLLVEVALKAFLIAIIFIAIKNVDNLATRLRSRARFFLADTVRLLDYLVFVLFCMLAYLARALMQP